MFDIGISLGFEGSTDEQIVAGLKAVANAVESVVVEDEKLTDAQKKLARSAVSLEEQINRNIRSYMSSASAIYAATAEELGYGEALKQKLDLLRQLEAETARLTKEQKDAAQKAKDEKDQIRDLTAEIKEKQRAEERRLAEKLKGEEDAARRLKKLAEDRIALEKQVAEVNAQIAERMISDAQRVALEQIAWSKKSVAERIAALEELKLLQNTPGITQEYVANKFGAGAMGDNNLAGYKTTQAAAKAAADAEKLAMEEIAWANKSWKERARITEAVTQHMGNAHISQEAIVRRFGQVAVEASKNHDAHVNAQRANLERLAKDTHGANRGLGEALQGLVGNARARSEIIVLMHELMTGQFKRFGQSLIVLAEYGGLAGYVLSATGAAVIGLGAAMVGTTILAAKGSLEFDHLNAVLKTTGDYSGLTTQSFYQMATAISGAHGTIGNAKLVMFGLAESGRFTRDQIDSIAPAILLMAETSHRPINELIKEFEGLGKSPVQASIALSEKYHYLTVAVYNQIAALEQQGNHQAAALLATDTYAKAGMERSQDLIKHLGYVAEAWLAVERHGSRAVNRIMSLGRPDMDKLTTANENVARIGRERDLLLLANTSPEAKIFRKNTEEMRLAQLERDKLIEEYRTREADAAAKGRDKAREQEAVDAQRDRDAKEKALYTPQQKREANIAGEYNKSATVIADFLRTKGVLRDAIEEAGKFEEARQFKTTAALLRDAEGRNAKLVALAKQSGVDISHIEAQTARIIDEAKKRNRDRVTPNTSFQVTTDRIKDAEAEFQATERLAKAEISFLQANANSEKRIAADKLSGMRATAKNENELHLVGLSAYETYTNKIKSLSEELVAKELEQIARMREANRTRFFLEQAAIAQQPTKTEHDRQDVFARSTASLQQYTAKIELLNAQEKSLKSNGANMYLEAQADAFRLMTQDLEQVHGALEKAYGKMLDNYKIIGMTKEQAKSYALQQKNSQSTIVESALIETQARLIAAQGNEAEVQALTERESLLKRILDLLRQAGVLDEKTRAQQTGTHAGISAALKSYLNEAENVFSATEKAASKAFKGMEDSLTKWVMTGKGGAKELANSIISDLIRIGIQQYITGPIAGSFLAMLAAPKAAGGTVASYSAQRVNENGPELLEVGGKSYLMMGSQPGNVVPNHQLGGGSTPGQQISITIHQTVGDVATVSMLQQNNASLVRQIRGGLARSQKYAGDFA